MGKRHVILLLAFCSQATWCSKDQIKPGERLVAAIKNDNFCDVLKIADKHMPDINWLKIRQSNQANIPLELLIRYYNSITLFRRDNDEYPELIFSRLKNRSDSKAKDECECLLKFFERAINTSKNILEHELSKKNPSQKKQEFWIHIFASNKDIFDVSQKYMQQALKKNEHLKKLLLEYKKKKKN